MRRIERRLSPGAALSNQLSHTKLAFSHARVRDQCSLFSNRANQRWGGRWKHPGNSHRNPKSSSACGRKKCGRCNHGDSFSESQLTPYREGRRVEMSGAEAEHTHTPMHTPIRNHYACGQRTALQKTDFQLAQRVIPRPGKKARRGLEDPRDPIVIKGACWNWRDNLAAGFHFWGEIHIRA